MRKHSGRGEGIFMPAGRITLRESEKKGRVGCRSREHLRLIHDGVEEPHRHCRRSSARQSRAQEALRSAKSQAKLLD